MVGILLPTTSLNTWSNLDGKNVREKVYEIILSDTLVSEYEKRFYLAQARIESGNFKRVRYNNYFGIKYKGRLKRFKSLKACYLYRKHLTAIHGKIDSKKYCPEKSYHKKIKTIIHHDKYFIRKTKDSL